MEIVPKSPDKNRYKITNWQEYNASLKKRGKISIWLSAKLLSVWREIDVRKVSVGEQIYPDAIIEFCLVVKYLYHLPLRQTTGYVEDLLASQGYGDFCVPNFSTLSRRGGDLPVSYTNRLKVGRSAHLLVDSTGLKVYGEGEWKVKKHGVSKHRTWLKLHLAIDAQTQEIVCMSLTKNSVDDASAGQSMLKPHQADIASVRGDGAYDTFSFREILGSEIVQIIPPPINAVLKVGTTAHPVPAHLLQRNEAVQRIKEVGRKEWKKEIGYHKRSLAETAMFRYKTIFGDKATARMDETQETEAKIKCKILNTFTQIGMPKSVEIRKK